MNLADVIANYLDRLEKGAFEISELATAARKDGNQNEARRLLGKLEGIQLASSYLEDELRFYDQVNREQEDD